MVTTLTRACIVRRVIINIWVLFPFLRRATTWGQCQISPHKRLLQSSNVATSSIATTQRHLEIDEYHFQEGVSGFTAVLFTYVLGWPTEDVEIFNASVRAATRYRTVHPMFDFVVTV